LTTVLDAAMLVIIQLIGITLGCYILLKSVMLLTKTWREFKNASKK